jgi:hypothetical protein
VFDLRGPVEAAMDQVSYPLRKTGPDVERRLDPKATVRANRTLLALVLANAVLEVLRALPAMVMVIDRDPSTGRETERVVGRSRLRVESVRRYDRVEVRVEGTPLPGAAVGTETWREWTIGHGLPVARRVVARLGGVLEEGPLRRWIRIDLPATDAPQSGP